MSPDTPPSGGKDHKSAVMGLGLYRSYGFVDAGDTNDRAIGTGVQGSITTSGTPPAARRDRETAEEIETGGGYTPPAGQERMDGGRGYRRCRPTSTADLNAVARFIATRPVMEPCLAAERYTGSRVSERWWDWEGSDLEGI